LRVFIDDAERDVFGREIARGRRGQFEFDLVARAQFVRTLQGCAPCDEHVAVFD
jgi:hypothetical protein